MTKVLLLIIRLRATAFLLLLKNLNMMIINKIGIATTNNGLYLKACKNLK